MNAAEQQAQAQQDVARITRELAAACRHFRGEESYGSLVPVVEELLRRDVIRVGARPKTTQPMRGQRTIDDERLGSFRSDLAQARELSARQAALT